MNVPNQQDQAEIIPTLIEKREQWEKLINKQTSIKSGALHYGSTGNANSDGTE
jgi:hypothetical protein